MATKAQQYLIGKHEPFGLHLYHPFRFLHLRFTLDMEFHFAAGTLAVSRFRKILVDACAVNHESFLPFHPP